jgi:hypothetical protein
MLGMCLMAQDHDGLYRRGADLRGSNWRSRRRAVLVSRRPRRYAPSVVALFSGRPPRSLSRAQMRLILWLVDEYGGGQAPALAEELREQVQRVLRGEPLAPVRPRPTLDERMEACITAHQEQDDLSTSDERAKPDGLGQSSKE